MRLAVAAGLAALFVASPAHASPAHTEPAHAEPACASDADLLRSHLDQAARATFRWNLAWGVLFGGAAVGQVVLAVTETKPFGTFDAAYRDTMYVGAAKATIGMASRIVMPIGVSVPPRSADRCAELVALRASLMTIAGKERRTFWLTHLGGTALNLAGAVYLWHRHSFSTGAISFAMSYPVGPISAYTLPRKSWHLWRDRRASWSVAIAVHPEHTMFTVAGEI